MMKSFIILNILVFVYVGGKEMFPAQPRLSYISISPKVNQAPAPLIGVVNQRNAVGGRWLEGERTDCLKDQTRPSTLQTSAPLTAST